MFARLKSWARSLKRESYALYLAARDPRTPLHAKLVVAAVAAYAFSPIDLIPDFIPVLGYLDDLIIVPLGIALAARLVPPEVMRECRLRAAGAAEKPRSLLAAGLIVAIWVLGVVTVSYMVYFHHRVQ